MQAFRVFLIFPCILSGWRYPQPLPQGTILGRHSASGLKSGKGTFGTRWSSCRRGLIGNHKAMLVRWSALGLVGMIWTRLTLSFVGLSTFGTTFKQLGQCTLNDLLQRGTRMNVP